MAIIFESLSLKGLRLSHLRQLRSYITIQEHCPYYYGPKKDFVKREKELKDWLDSAIRYAEEADVRFPK